MTPTYETREDFWRALPKGLVIAELGVFKGDHAREIHRLAEPSTLHLVDRWKGMHTCCDSNYENPCTVDLDKTYFDVWARLGVCQGVQVWRADSFDWLLAQPFDSLDVIYLDDDHSYEHVKRQLAIVPLLVRPGGWLCGHDYNATHFPGVVRAVDEFRATLPDAEFHVSGELLASWFLRMPE